MTDQAHSPLGPSGGERWINCPGSVNATRGVHDPSSEFAAEGNFAHDIAEMAREQNKPAKEFIGYAANVDGFDFECDAEMARHIQYFIDYVNQFECEENLNEQKVEYDAWVDGGFGTLDAGLLTDDIWIVADLKYGTGIKVFAENNTQLKMYALGLYQKYCDLYECNGFKLCIVQPRLDHIDEWEISLDELIVWADEVLEPAADEAMSDTARFKAGPWCTNYFCKIRSTCKTRADAIKQGLLDEIEDIRDPNEMDNDELGEAFAVAELAMSWASDVKAIVEKKVLAGEEIIGKDGLPMKMVAGRNVRAWRDQVAAEKAMRNYKVRVGDMWKRTFISPAQAEKLSSIGKGHPILEKHVVTTQGKPTLVYGSDSRPDYRTSSDEMEDLGDE